jgi:hypothetical protein
MIDFLKRHASANVKESLQTSKNRLPVQNETSKNFAHWIYDHGMRKFL